jgi:hypothetical protein
MTLFMEHGLQKTINLKLILSVFEQLSSLKINFYKSEIFRFGEALTEKNYQNQGKSILIMFAL